VFGRVVEGMEAVDRISVSPTGAMGPFKQESPMQPVIIQKIDLLTDGLAPAPKAAPSAVPVDAPPAAATAPAGAPPTTPPATAPTTPPAKPASEPASESPPPK
jgi:hypothetical protein